MPTKIEKGPDGQPARMITSYGPGMDSVASITEWHPPKSFTAETEGGPDKVATEWIVEARAGGTCLVRVVHRWFADSDDWDGEFEGTAYGWATSFFRILRMYLTHFPGQPCSDVQLTAFSTAPARETWRTITDALEIDKDARRFTSTSGAPELSGTVEHLEITDPELLRVRERAPQVVAAFEAMDGEEPELLLRLDRPAPGSAHIFIMPMGDRTMVSMRLFLYGDQVAAIVADAKRQWNEWLTERFPQEAQA